MPKLNNISLSWLVPKHTYGLNGRQKHNNDNVCAKPTIKKCQKLPSKATNVIQSMLTLLLDTLCHIYRAFEIFLFHLFLSFIFEVENNKNIWINEEEKRKQT